MTFFRSGVAALGAVVLLWAVLYPAFKTRAEAGRSQTMLVVMVRNEAPIIARLLRSFRARVATHLFICDTGSTDDTLSTALAEWRPADSVRVHRARPFVNFEQSRNECRIEATRSLPEGVEWIALADADFTAELRPGVHEPATADVNAIQVHNGHYTFALHMLVRASVYRDACRYRLWVHEFLECNETITYGNYNGMYYRDHSDGSSRTVKLERDIALLESWLRAVNETDLRPRALYYLARAYEDSGRLERALETYAAHNREQQFTNYLFYARYRIGLVLIKQNATMARIESAMLDAQAQYDGYFRREPLIHLAHAYAARGNWSRCVLYTSAALHAPTVDHSRMPLFLETALYTDDSSLWSYCASKLKI